MPEIKYLGPLENADRVEYIGPLEEEKGVKYIGPLEDESKDSGGIKYLGPLEEMPTPTQTKTTPRFKGPEMPWSVKHPYVTAIGQTALSMVPWARFLNPETRKAFVQKSIQSPWKATGEMLLQDVLPTIPVAGLTGSIATKGLEKTLGFIPTLGRESLAQQAVKGATEAGAKIAVGKTANAELDKGGWWNKAVPEATKEPHWTADFDATMPTANELKPAKMLDLGTQKNIYTKAIEDTLQNPDNPILLNKNQRVFRGIAEWVSNDAGTPEGLREILTKHNITPDQLAEDVIRTGSYAGKTLNQLSQQAKKINKLIAEAYPDSEYAKNLLNSMDKTSSGLKFYDSLWEGFKKVDNIRRSAMVAQLATAARNAISQSGRYGVKIFDDAIEGYTNFAKGQPLKESYSKFLNDFVAFGNRFRPAKRAELDNLLSKYPLEKAQLFSAPVQDVAMGQKVANLLNTPNRWQEYFFRKMTFDAVIRSEAEKKGFNLITDVIPDSSLDKAVKESLSVTFAEPIKTEAGKWLSKAYDIKGLGIIPRLIQPYPRFWMNSVKFLWDYSPMGFITTASRSKMLSKNPHLAADSFAKAMTGSLMLGMAMEMRNSEFAGPKYYQIRIPDSFKKLFNIGEPGKKSYFDTRPFAPFSSYLFFAEQMLHPERVNSYDRMQGIIGINRIAGSGLALFDLVTKDQRPENVIRQLKEIAGQYLGGFTVPARTAKDIMAGTISPVEGVSLSTKGKPIIGPAISNIPVVGVNTLPAAPRLTRPEPYKQKNPILRQITGTSVQNQTPLEDEMARLNMSGMFPRTGDPELDDIITKNMGPIVEKLGGIIAKPQYGKMADDAKKYVLTKEIQKIKQYVTSQTKIPWYEKKVGEMDNSTDKFQYIFDLAKRGKIGTREFAQMFVRDRFRGNKRYLTPDQWKQIGRTTILE